MKMFILGSIIAASSVLALYSTAIAADTAGRILLTSGKNTSYQIVISSTPSDNEKKAAAELQKHIREISGAELQIVPDTKPASGKEIIIGKNNRLESLDINIDWKRLGKEGFTIKTVGNNLIIAGGPTNGTLYGTYTFIEDYLGYKWLSDTVNVVPKRKFIYINNINDTQVPALSYREVYYYEAMDPAFAERMKLNGNYSICRDGKTVIERHRGWGTWCHSFFNFVPPSEYFSTHPEYYSMINGQRVPDKQLCLSNPDVLKIAVKSMKEYMAVNPDITIWDVSQMDTDGYCTCPECKAIDDREGTPMGSILTFVNKVAEQIPDKTISTLSYWYSVKPPKNIKPAPNVHIMLCNIGCSRSQPIDTDKRNADFKKDMEEWAKICDKIDIWDYVIQFSNLSSPFPNFRVLQPNMQFFVKYHAKGVFSQGNREANGEFANLRAYMLAKLSWNPNCDIDKVMNDFLNGYYGKAAKPIRKYIDTMHDALDKSGSELMIFQGPRNAEKTYLTPELMAKYKSLFDEAEKLVADQPDVLWRVKAARMPIEYAQLELGYGDVQERQQVANSLYETAEKTGLKQFSEGGISLAEYKNIIKERLSKK